MTDEEGVRCEVDLCGDRGLESDHFRGFGVDDEDALLTAVSIGFQCLRYTYSPGVVGDVIS